MITTGLLMKMIADGAPEQFEVRVPTAWPQTLINKTKFN